jgi:hypothetical protein
MLQPNALSRLTRMEKCFLGTLVLGAALFGAIVVLRTAFLSRHMGDLGCYLRTAWAVRAGADIYAIEDDNHWHYSYPPLLAILLTPLADPPPGVDRAGMMPFGLSAAIWYLISLACLLLGVNVLARALEETYSIQPMHGQPLRCRRWWALRLMPILACLPPIAHTLMRGQVNLLLLALLCATAASVLRGQSFRAGLWLAGAICLKIIPAFLLVYPIWRRDSKFLAGAAAGLLLGLGIIPALTFGPRQTMEQFAQLGRVLIGPSLGMSADESRAKELINVTATDSQSLLATLHNTLHLERATRPPQASSGERLISFAVGGFLTLAALATYGWRKRHAGPADVALFGALVLNMLLLSPVCHLHYFCMSILVIMVLLAWRWQGQESLRPGVGLGTLLFVNLCANVLPLIPGLDVLRDCGLAMYGTLLVWGAGVLFLWRQTRSHALSSTANRAEIRAAA